MHHSLFLFSFRFIFTPTIWFLGSARPIGRGIVAAAAAAAAVTATLARLGSFRRWLLFVVVRWALIRVSGRFLFIVYFFFCLLFFIVVLQPAPLLFRGTVVVEHRTALRCQIDLYHKRQRWGRHGCSPAQNSRNVCTPILFSFLFNFFFPLPACFQWLQQ